MDALVLGSKTLCCMIITMDFLRREIYKTKLGEHMMEMSMGSCGFGCLFGVLLPKFNVFKGFIIKTLFSTKGAFMSVFIVNKSLTRWTS